MARLLTEGAENGLMTPVSAANGGGHAGYGISSSVKRTGSYSFGTGDGGGDYLEFVLVPAASPSEWYARIAFYASGGGAGRMFEWLSGANEGGSLRTKTWGSGVATLEVYDGTTLRATSSPFTMNPGEWHVFEIHVKHAANPNGVIEVKFDGTRVINFAGATNAQASTDRFRGVNCGGGACYFDDLAFNDTTGPSDNSWCGDGGVLAALVPNGAGTYTDLIASAGNAYQAIDEIPPNSDTDYVYESTLDKKSTYQMADLAGLPVGATIQRVWVELYAKCVTADGSKIATLLRSNTTDSQGTDQALTTAYTRYKSADYATDPQDGSAWSAAKVNALEAGAVIR